MALNYYKNVRTTEIKNDGDQVLVVTENETYRFDAPSLRNWT